MNVQDVSASARSWLADRWRVDPDSDSATGHDHDLPRSLLALVTVIVLGFTTAVVIVYVALTARVSALEEYVAGRGEVRDAENARRDERTRTEIAQAVCDVLDQLPPDITLDRVRIRYGCGPGEIPTTTEETP